MLKEKEISILYKNHRGETGIRWIIPIELVFDSTEYHPQKQWLLRAFALDRQEERLFAVKEILNWYVNSEKP